ncbi:MAG: multidrug effflux MFS transporter, partial [Tidjanibacter sp.]|nr:multidrug effflux MFS transporter [Tidjanibacter sp.]
MQTGIPYSHAKTSAARYSNYLIVLLGILTAFGPLVTDMYLPTLPSMTVYFGTSQSMVQMGLTTSMAGLALGQLLFGPLSDKFGRRPLLLVSLLLFVASTVICIFSPTVYVFVGMRLFQGIGAAGGIVISRSVATDRYRGKELVKVLAVIGVINGIAPVAAPVLGGVLTDAVGWRGIFVILLAIGVILLGSSMLFRESLPPRRRAGQSLLRTFGNFGTILRNKRFILYVLQLGFAQGILFANIASSPFIIQEHYGFSALEFSIVFAVNSLAFMAAAPLSLRFRRPQDGIMASCIGMCVLSVAELAALWCRCSFWVYEGILFLLLFTMALTFTLSTT